jgi:hypothetical protein
VLLLLLLLLLLDSCWFQLHLCHQMLRYDQAVLQI